MHHLGKGYGYQIAKAYNEIFPKVSQRSIYYHLRKGVALDELKVSKIKMEKGDYSWGDKAEKIYYSLGRLGSAKGEARVKEFFRKK